MTDTQKKPPVEPTNIITPGVHQFSIDTDSGDWLTANRTTSGVFFDRSGIVYLDRDDRRALIKWLAETQDEPPKPTRPGKGRPKRPGTHGRENGMTAYPHELAAAIEREELDAYLELRSGKEIAADILALTKYKPPVPCELRDYFAAAALTTVSHHWAEGDAKHAARVAEQCYAFADAMIAERERKPT